MFLRYTRRAFSMVGAVALRLKELETLEKITEKIEHLSVYGGLEGLLKQLLPFKPGGEG